MDVVFAVFSAVACLTAVVLFPRHAQREQDREDGIM